MLFSVIIPFYNIENYVDKCIQSILNQTCGDFELIAVDDGSTDSTGMQLDKYKENDPRIKVIHKKNGGLTSARKAGAQECKGDYVVIVDGDDWINENYLEKFKEIICVHIPDVAICGYYMGEENNLSARSPYSSNGCYGFYDKDRMDKEYLPYLFKALPMVWGKAYKRELYLKYQLQIDDNITMGEDMAISYPCIAYAESLYILDEPLYYYRQNPESMTRSRKKYLSWEKILFRIAHIEKVMPLDRFNYRNDFYGYAAHSLFNVVLSHLKNDKYTDAVKCAKAHLKEPKIRAMLDNAAKNGCGVNKILAKLLKYRAFLIMKLFTFIH